MYERLNESRGMCLRLKCDLSSGILRDLQVKKVKLMIIIRKMKWKRENGFKKNHTHIQDEWILNKYLIHFWWSADEAKLLETKITISIIVNLFFLEIYYIFFFVYHFDISMLSNCTMYIGSIFFTSIINRLVKLYVFFFCSCLYY